MSVRLARVVCGRWWPGLLRRAFVPGPVLRAVGSPGQAGRGAAWPPQVEQARVARHETFRARAVQRSLLVEDDGHVRSRVRAKFHYTDTDTDPHGPNVVSPQKSPCPCPCRVRVGVHVVEFSSYPTTCADFVRVGSVSGPCPCPCSGI